MKNPAYNYDYHTKKVYSEDPETLRQELSEAPDMQCFAQEREKKKGEVYLPDFHFVRSMPDLMNDANGLCYYGGHWHLFYQAYCSRDNAGGTMHWGHAYSDDLYHWRDLPDALYPEMPEEDACWSGNVIADGARAIALYFGWNRGWNYGLVTATSTHPLLINWQKCLEGAPVVREKNRNNDGEPYKIYDPCIFRDGGFYYALSGRNEDIEGGTYQRQGYLFRSTDLVHWEYLHPFLREDHAGMAGDDMGCPYFYPIGDGSRWLLLHFCHRLQLTKYAIGTLDEEKYFHIIDGGTLASMRAIHAPSAYPDGKGGIILICNMFAGAFPVMTMPRRLTLGNRGIELNVEPAGDYPSLRGEHMVMGETVFPCGEEIVLPVAGRSFEMDVTFEAKDIPALELNFLRSQDGEEVTRVTFLRNKGSMDVERDVSWESCKSLLVGDTLHSSKKQPLGRQPEVMEGSVADGEALHLHIFCDKSIMEVFLNDRTCMTLRMLPEENSTGISVRPMGADIRMEHLDFWKMKSIWTQE